MYQHRVIVNIQELNKRGASLPAILSPLTSRGFRLGFKPRTTSQLFELSVFDGTTQCAGRQLFSTFVKNVAASYTERWQRHADYYYLCQAYLHLYRIENCGSDLRELLLLHCDPNLPLGEKDNLYKRSTHLHVEISEDPLPRAHLCLSIGDPESCIESISSLSRTFQNAVVMLRNEVLERYKN